MATQGRDRYGGPHDRAYRTRTDLWVKAIAPYVPGRATTDDGRKVAKLSSNENPLGTSEKARAAFAAAANNLERYPDAGATALREAIGAVHGLDPARIIYGTGSDEILHLAAGAFAGPGMRSSMSAMALRSMRSRPGVWAPSRWWSPTMTMLPMSTRSWRR